MPADSAPGERVAILCHGGGGGSTRAAMTLAAALDRQGRDVLLVTLGRPRWRPPARLRHIVLQADRPGSGRLDVCWSDASVQAIACELASVCRQENVGLLHFHYGLPFAAASAALRQRLGPSSPTIVATLHGGDITATTRDPRLRSSLGRALQDVDAVSTVSTNYAGLLRAGIDHLPPLAVVPNFLAADRAPPSLALQRPARPPTIIHVSNFRSVKDTRSVARVFLAVRRHLSCRLMLVGDGPDWRGMRHLLRSRMRDVDLLGFRTDVGALLQRADLLLLASHAESFSLAALEAMAAGVPVVAPRVGGLPEVIGDGGRLFHPGRIGDAAAAILSLIHAPERLRRLSGRARHRVTAFSEADAVARYEAVYRLARVRRAAALPAAALA